MTRLSASEVAGLRRSILEGRYVNANEKNSALTFRKIGLNIFFLNKTWHIYNRAKLLDQFVN